MKRLFGGLLLAAALALPAAAAAHGGDHFKRHNDWGLREVGTGHVTSAGTPDCQHVPGVCTVTAAGTITGRPIANGTFGSSWTIDWAHATSNGHGGFCAPATGTTTLADSATPANTITKAEQGKVCEVGATGATVEHVGFGTYTVTAATGTLAPLVGSTGRFWFDQKPDGTVKALEVGRGGVLGAHHDEHGGDHHGDHHGDRHGNHGDHHGDHGDHHDGGSD
jgi:hypothetical protein